MKRFISRVCLFTLTYILITIALSFVFMPEGDGYISEYNRKVRLLETTPQPRMIIIAGSSAAYGIDSKRIMDSLHINVVNFGLHAGLGIKLPMEDCFRFVKRGDIVVVPMEYSNFFNGGNSDSGLLYLLWLSYDKKYRPSFTHWSWDNIFLGINKHNIDGMKPRLVKINKNEGAYGYSKDNFNEYGDEVRHRDFKGKRTVERPKGIKESREVDPQFMEWLERTIRKYEEAGARVVLLPPVCVASFFDEIYNDHIKEALRQINRPYLVEPTYMVLHDSCMFDTRYHVNGEGVKQNTAHIISALKKM